MKKVIAFVPAYFLCWLGDKISLTSMINTGFGYRVYNTCMNWSEGCQQWAKLSGPWQDAEEEYDGEYDVE